MALTKDEQAEIRALEADLALRIGGGRDNVNGGLSKDEAAELAALEKEFSEQTNISNFADASPPPDDNFSLTRALLTNEPARGFGESFVRGIPSQAGGFLAGATGGAASGGLASIPFAIGGAAAGEGVRQSLAQAYATATGRPLSTPGQIARGMATEGAFGGLGQGISAGLGGVGKYVVKQLPAKIQNFVGIPEKLSQYVQKRGTGQVFTSPNLAEGAATRNIAEAAENLSTARTAAGESIGSAEKFILDIGAGQKPIDTSAIASELRGKLFRGGYTDPRTSTLARSKEASILRELAETLESLPAQNIPMQTTDPFTGAVSEAVEQIPGKDPLNLRQIVNAKRLIDQNLEFAGKEISAPAEAILKETNHKLREIARSELGVGKLYDDFSKIANAQEKLSKFIGTRGLSSSEQRAVDSLKTILVKNPNEADKIVKILGAGLPEGEKQARTIFDSIVAQEFTKAGKGAPSNIILKALSAIGITGGAGARTMLRIGEAGFDPALLSYGASTTGSAIGDQYINR